MKTRLWLCLLSVLLSTSVQAFEIKTRSENPAISDAVLRAAVLQASNEVGTRIPDDPNIKVSVFTRAQPSKIGGKTIYLHRVQLTKAFAGEPPYPYRGWLPIRTFERYGIWEEATVRTQLDEMLRDFFNAMKKVDPAKGVE